MEMGIIAWIVVGLIAGWLAHIVLGGRGGLFGNLAVGLVGGWLFGALHIVPAPGFAGNLITAVIGAVIFLFLWRAIRRA